MTAQHIWMTITRDELDALTGLTRALGGMDVVSGVGSEHG